MKQDDIDEALGITRCVCCGHRLEGEVGCPFCSLFPDKPRKEAFPEWVFITACFLASPLSLYAVITTKRLNFFEKVLACSGGPVLVRDVSAFFLRSDDSCRVCLLETRTES